MDAAVPFALVAAVQLLALAAAIGLAAAGGAAAYRRSARAALVAGGVCLAAAHGFTGAVIGTAGGDEFALLRAAGYALVAVGTGGLTQVAAAPAAVVVPLGAAPGPAWLAALAAVLGAVSAARIHRPGRALLVASFALNAGAEVIAPNARTATSAAVVLLVLRGLAALALLGFVGRLVETSLLGKVVAAILAAVLGLALGTALVVGSVATGSLNEDSQERLADVARGQVDILLNEKQTSLSLARVLAGCPGGQARVCTEQVFATTARSTIVAVLCNPRNDACRKRNPDGVYVGLDDDPVARTSLRTNDAVEEVLNARGEHPVATLAVILGRTPSLIAAGVYPSFEGSRAGRPYAAAVYATRVDEEYVRAIGTATGLDATLYVEGQRIATTRRDAGILDAELRRLGVLDTLRDSGADGVSLGAEGSRPGVRYQAVRSEDGQLLGVLALSAESDVILATQRRVLSSLFLGTLGIALLVGVLALALGRRIVRPVTELTIAASRVRRGDLDVRTEVTARDELGVLSRTFDAMTASLAASNESLREAAEQEARLRGRLETVVDSIDDGLLTTNAADEVVGINRAALELLGCDEAVCLGRPVTELLAGTVASGEALLPALRSAATGRTGRLARADGGSVPVALAATPLRGAEGHVVVLRDLTREHEVERMKTEFLSNVSHELRTPLTPIRGYAEILNRRPDLPPEKTSLYAGSILESSVRMSRVVDLLVDVASLEAGRVEPHVVPVPAGQFIDDRLAAWRKREPGREFRRRVAARLPEVLIDPQWVAKAYDELVDNAVKYSTAAVTLAATLSEDGRHVRLTVRDSGEGIPDDRRAALFTPFEQVDGSATRAVGGLGLGLSFVRRVADDFSLDVVVESTLGKGSAFSLEVPAAARTAPRPKPRSTRSPKGRSR
jgi:PAS domain S-box-containing protein